MKQGLCLLSFLLSFSTHAASLSDIDWIAGSWSDSKGMEEHITSSDGGKILGMAKLVAAGKLAFFEFYEIDENAGNLVLKPMPFGKAGVHFTSSEVKSDRAVFENPKHDFPQKITFVKKSGTELLIQVEGTQGGKAVKFDTELKSL